MLYRDLDEVRLRLGLRRRGILLAKSMKLSNLSAHGFDYAIRRCAGRGHIANFLLARPCGIDKGGIEDI